MRVLYIPLEFKTWDNATHLPYPGNYGFEEGFDANGVEYMTIPAIYETRSSQPGSWLYRIRELCSGVRFDQVWFEVVHSRYDEGFLEYLSSLCSVRIGFVWESSEMRPDELLTNPEGARRRREDLQRNLSCVTHVVAVDEQDVADFNVGGKISAKWVFDAGMLPASCINTHKPRPVGPPTLFYGALYGERKKWLEHPLLRDVLIRPQASPEYMTELPALFDQLNEAMHQFLLCNGPIESETLFTYMRSLRTLRKKAFSLWMDGLREGMAVVNLPQFGKAYASRVQEGMAVGRPVITWKLSDRPRTEALFEDGREILLYDQDSPEQLAEHIHRLIREPEWGRKIADNARRKYLAHHTVEELVRQILDWTEAPRTTAGVRPLQNGFSSASINLGAADRKGSVPGNGANTGETSQPDLMYRGGDGGASIRMDPPTEGIMKELISRRLWTPGTQLRLHLGCGEQRLEGYVNIDYPPAEHSVMTVRADVHVDILSLEFPPGTVDEIRLHHVFEHFNRVTALVLLIRWHSWLRIGGMIHIETPDLVGSAKTLLSEAPWKTKMGVVRHLAGDQAASWAYHVDHWFPERFEQTLSKLGFDSIRTQSSSWPVEPFLANVTAIAQKSRNVAFAEQTKAAERILWESTVAVSERPTHEVWKGQLSALLCGAGSEHVPIAQLLEFSRFDKTKDILSESGSKLPLSEIHDFNQRARDQWVSTKAVTVPAGSIVLDVGAGTCPYRGLFAHCDYRAHDFKRYHGEKLGGTTQYGVIDYESDICSIPVADSSFDVVLCTEVLEHVPQPIEALKEMARILKPGGRLLLTAPLGSGLHQLPYHYYGGYSPEWYRHFCPQFDLEVGEIVPNGGFFKLLAQECARVAGILPQHQHLHGDNLPLIRSLFAEWLPRYLFALEDQCFNEQFTVGYHVEAVKKDLVETISAVQKRIDSNPQDAGLYIQAARILSARGQHESAHEYLEDARELDPDVPGLAELLSLHGASQ